MRTFDPSATQEVIDQVEHEKVRATVEYVFKMQMTAPLGWLLVLGLVWTRAPLTPTLNWIACFAVLLAIIMNGLAALRRRSMSLRRKRFWLHVLAGIDGLGWGSMPLFSFGDDLILSSWLVTVLCGVAAVNGPPRALLSTSYATQLLAMWLPVLLYGVQHRHVEGSLQMVVGMAVLMVLMLVYVRNIERVMSNNLMLRLQNTELSAQLRRSLSAVEREAATDPLTEQANRREMNRVLMEVDRRRRTSGDPYSLLMLDIDHFKQINDRFGHDVGDETLKAFALRVSDCLRPTDLLARTGGEEFTVLLRGAALDDATAIASRICETVAAQPLLSTPLLHVTVSIGVAQQRGQQTPSEVAKRCDLAVYEAKRSGRNRVSVALAA